jgi:ubiquinone biosynthesis protein COQ4
MDESDLPYLMRGRRQITTESTVLISSSKYLNDIRIRDWVVNQSLKRNGNDIPPTYGIPRLIEAVREVQEHERIEELFLTARREWPELDRWFDERYLSTLKREDMKACPPGSIGGIWYAQLKGANMEVDIIPTFEPRSSFEYFFLRGVQIHDFMHILAGGGFNELGEIIPAFLKFGNLFRWFEPELAGLLNVQNSLLSLPMLMRNALNYPEVFLLSLDLANYALEVGKNSNALFLYKYEDWLDLPVEEARARFGVHGARTIDTQRESDFVSGRAPQSQAAE